MSSDERIPILRLGDVLLVTIQVELHDRLALTLLDELTERVVETSAKGVVIDISAVEVVDSFIGRLLRDIAATSAILDATTVLVGMRPAVAVTLVELGLSLDGVLTALDLDKGLELITRHRSARSGRAPRSSRARA